MTEEEIKAAATQIAELLPRKDHIETFLGQDDEWHSRWIGWRQKNPQIVPRLAGVKAQNRSWQDIELQNAVLCDANFRHCDLYKANLSEANCRNAHFRNARLMHASFVGADLSYADFNHADASNADFRGANLYGASLYQTILTQADFRGANLSEAVLPGAILTRANLSGLDLRGAHMQNCVLVGTDLSGTDISGANVYGISVWNVNTEGTVQRDLIITPDDESRLAIDDLEFAQFTYLLLNNKSIRHLIDTITSKVVLILGRFTPERKAVLDSIRDELRKRYYIPVLFDFEKPANRDITETVSTLAHMARFVIADLSDPKSIPHELAHVAPLLPSVPIMPLIVRPQDEYSMFEHFFGFQHVLKPFRYRNEEHLLASLETKVILPAEKLAGRVAGNRSRRR